MSWGRPVASGPADRSDRLLLRLLQRGGHRLQVYPADDVRTHGSGNAGLTNFYRTFGGPLTFVVILTDVLKAVVVYGLASWRQSIWWRMSFW